MTSGPALSSPAARGRLLAAGLAVAVLLVFGPGLVGDFVWDDVTLIQSNAYVRDLSQLGTALTHDFWHSSSRAGAAGVAARPYYRPVVTLAYAVQFRLFGESPFGYHAVSLALHVACVLLALGWLRRRLGGERATVAAALGAGLFALHPSRPESVTWVSGSTDLWMGLWALLGLTAWDRRRDALGTALTCLCAALAVFSKEPAIALPLLLLTDAALLDGSRDEKVARAKRAAAVLLAAALAMGARALVVPLRVPGGAPEGPLRAALRVLSSLGHYVAQVAFPWPQTAQVALITYDARGMPAYAPWSVALGALAAAGFAALAVRAARDARLRPWLADALWFLVPLAPTLNVVPMRLNVLVAPRFLYVPMLGVAALCARAALRALERDDRRARAATALAAGVALVASGVASLVHVGHFITEEDLWAHEHAVNPGNSFALGELARMSARRGRVDEAFRWLAQGYAAAVRNRSGDQAVEFALRGTNLLLWTTPDADQETLRKIRGFLDAFVLGERGRAVLDTPAFRVDFALRPEERAMRARLGLDAERAWAYARTQEFDEAERQLRDLVRRNPASTSGWRYLATVAAGQEHWGLALRAADVARRLVPGDPELAALGPAIAQGRARLASQPAGDALLQALARAALYVDLGLYERARRLLDPVLAAHPGRPEPALLRARADVADRQYAAARATLAAARARDPAHAADYDRALAAVPTGP